MVNTRTVWTHLRAKRYDTIQWLEISRVMSCFFSSKNRGKENAYFCAVVVEVKHWKSLIHWTTQTFSERLLFKLCGSQTRTESLDHNPPVSKATLQMQHVCPERRRMGVYQSKIYSCLPLYSNCSENFYTTFVVPNTRYQFLVTI